MSQQDFLKEFTEFISSRGMCVTAQRRAIAQAFFSFPGHHTSDEFHQHMSAIDASIGQTTVYRTLKLLCAAGLASEITFRDNIARYEVANPSAHHDHLICVDCGRIVEIYDPRVEAIQAELAQKHGFSLEGHSHNLYGICPQCAAKVEQAASCPKNTD